MTKIARDSDGRITGYFLYAGDEELSTLTGLDRLQWPVLAAMADQVPRDEVLREHPATGPLQGLIYEWCDRRELWPLAAILPAYIGLGTLQSWRRLIDTASSMADDDRLPNEDRNVLRVVAAEAGKICDPSR